MRDFPAPNIRGANSWSLILTAGPPFFKISFRDYSHQTNLSFLCVENPRVSLEACRIAVLVWSHSTSGGEFAVQLDLSSLDRMFSWKSTLMFYCLDATNLKLFLWSTS